MCLALQSIKATFYLIDLVCPNTHPQGVSLQACAKDVGITRSKPSPFGIFETSSNVCSSVAIGGKADVPQISPNRRS
jgi:hypothetical protein